MLLLLFAVWYHVVPASCFVSINRAYVCPLFQRDLIATAWLISGSITISSCCSKVNWTFVVLVS